MPRPSPAIESDVPATDQTMIGRRPMRSESRPQKGTKKNCMSE
jgi:hypothetical protein